MLVRFTIPLHAEILDLVTSLLLRCSGEMQHRLLVRDDDEDLLGKLPFAIAL